MKKKGKNSCMCTDVKLKRRRKILDSFLKV